VRPYPLRLPERATIADVAKAGHEVCASDWVRLAAERRLPVGLCTLNQVDP
jgi:hypothetical protein